MFRRLPGCGGAEVRFDFEGAPVDARRGDSVAAALLAAGHLATRETPVSGEARGPYCLIGVCFECLVEIDGVANAQACLVEARDGMRVRRMRGARAAPAGDANDAGDPS